MFKWSIDDKDLVIPDQKALDEFRQMRAQQTPMERLRKMYTLDETMELSPELNAIKQSLFFGGFVGVIYGGFIESRNSYTNFMERNQATAFENHYEAKKELQTKVTTGFSKGAFRWGWRLAFFTTIYTGVSTTIASYRGKSSIWEYMAAGACAGTVFKFNMGLKGMASGGVIGCAFGTLAGALTLGVMKLTGTSVEDIQYWQHRMQLKRLKIVKDAIAVDMNYSPSPLEMNHEMRVGTDKLSLDALDVLEKQLEEAEKRQKVEESSKK